MLYNFQIQFVLSLVNSAQAALFGCLPTAISFWNMLQSTLFFMMFFDFYKHTYKEKKLPTKPTKSNGTAHTNGLKHIDINENDIKCDKKL